MDRRPPSSSSSSSSSRRGRSVRTADERRALWQQSIAFGPSDSNTGIPAGTLTVLSGLELDEMVSLAIFSMGTTTVAADPAVIRTVSPVEPLPGMSPPADVNLLTCLDLPVPQEADWHVATVDATRALPEGADSATIVRYAGARVSLPSALVTEPVPVRKVRPLPPLLEGTATHGICGCVVGAADHPPVMLLIDLLAIIRDEFTRR